LAPLWGAALLASAAVAERALTMPVAGAIEIAAIVAWVAGVGAIVGGGLTASAAVLLASGGAPASSSAGLAAGALLAVVPAVLARRLVGRSRS
jgi:hypothetical protein